MAANRTLDIVSRPRLRIEEIFDLSFNEHQFKHYLAARTFVGFPRGDVTQEEIDRTREWLANNVFAAQGRTTLLGMCFLEWSVTRPGKRVDYFDHYVAAGRQETMRRTLQYLVDRNPTFKHHVEFIKDQAALRFRPLEPN